jgi:phosphoadenosine phosphosulfate reductase
MANIKYRAIYKNTTIDPPGTIAHVRRNGVEVLQPKENFRQIVERKGLPSRMRRHCCDILKEYKVLPYAVIGVRRDESSTRAEYEEPTVCREYKKDDCAELYMPLLDFTAKDIADFIMERGIKCHPLYYDEDGTFHVERRLGCMGCPLASKKQRMAEFKAHPQMAKYYIKGAQRFLDTHPDSKVHGYFKDACEWFTYTLYCDNLEEFRYMFGVNMFGESIDCKQHLQELFGIDL